MSPLPRRVGHAERETLFALIDRTSREWDSTCSPLHESREFTIALLERLIQRGYVQQTGDTYRPTRAGITWTDKYSVPR